MIVVFSGTGNSRYVADMLADILKDEVFDANRCIKERKKVKLHSEKPWIFIAPVYVSAPPKIFMKFLEKSVFTGSRKAYFINTCAGRMGACPYYNEIITTEKNMICMGTNQIVMPQNYLVFFKTRSEEVSDQIVQDAHPAICALAEKIQKELPFDDPGMKKWEVLSTRLILNWYYRRFMKAKAFYVTNACIHCGKCEKVCPLKNVRMKDGHPVWGRNCTHCMACINACPKEAIEYGRYSVGKPRYFCRKYKK